MSSTNVSSTTNSSTSTNTTSSSSPSISSSSGSSSSAAISAGIIIAVIIAVVIILLSVCICIKRRRKRRRDERRPVSLESQYGSFAAPPDDNALMWHPGALAGRLWGSTAKNVPQGSSRFGPLNYSYKQLRIATKNFSASELLGAGGFGSVYRGTLADDGTSVAVKCMAENSKQGVKEFKAEVTIISDLRHRNLVRLRGWCHDQGKFLLVYEYMSNGSLDYLLFNDSLCSKLSWERRYAIASGLGLALQYLHEGCARVIIHRDIKSSNVLLDENFNAKLGDFGLSRQVDQGITSHTTTVAGTRGYMAPECFLSRKATRETDVYAFGVVLLEVVSGKRAIDASLQQYEGMLVDWVWHLHSQGRVMEAVDKRLTEGYENEEARRMLMVGLLCSNPDPKARPKINQASQALTGSVPLPFVPSSKPILTFGGSNEHDSNFGGL